MKKALSLILAVVMILSVGFVVPINAEDADFTNTICTIRNENGFLDATGAEKGKALTVSENEKEWRFKKFLGGSYSFVGEGDLAADVNGASVKEGVTIIQWTSTGANNQRWTLEEADGGKWYIKSVFSNLYVTETEGVITQEVKAEEKNQTWEINVVGAYEPLVEKMLESDAVKSLSEYRYERLYDFIMSGGEFNLLTYDKIEKMISERDYFNLSYEEQVKFVEECFTVVPTDLMYGSMATKLQRDIAVEFVGIEENVWQSWHGIPEESARRYDVTIRDKENGDSHTFKYYSTFDNDEEYAKTVGEAVACFEMPIAKTLHRFIYTSMNTSSWNGGDNTIWNNTGYRGDVNNMVQMFAHELGHVMDNGRQANDVWYRAIAQDMVPVTGYGNTNRWEDLAEFSRLYLLAKGDEMRIAAIENTYPARTKAYKGLLYAVDNKFYKDYRDEAEAVWNAVGDWEESMQLKLSIDGKYLTDLNGELALAEKKEVIDAWQTWEVYTAAAGNSVFRNKATGRYVALVNGKLTLGNATALGLKKTEGTEFYEIIDGSTGFCIDENLESVVENGVEWKVEAVGNIPHAGEKILKLQATGEKVSCADGEYFVMDGIGETWNFIPVDKDYFVIMEKSGNVFDVSGNSTANGARVIPYFKTGGTNQHFSLINNGDGSYKLCLRHSGLYLTKTPDGFCQSDGSLGYVNWVIE